MGVVYLTPDNLFRKEIDYQRKINLGEMAVNVFYYVDFSKYLESPALQLKANHVYDDFNGKGAKNILIF